METPTLQRNKSPESQKQSFDVLASVRLYRSDLEMHGEILPETKERVFDEELTFVAEGINRPLYTSFKIQESDGQLTYFDQGEWKPYMSMLVTGLEVAENEVAQDPRKMFLAERAAEDLAKGYQLEGMASGETTVWHSPFPYRELELYGEKFLKEEGFQPDRKMGFIYRAHKNEDGSLTLESHSVDNSDEEAFKKMEETSKYDPSVDMDTLVRTYDGALKSKHKKDFRAGRISDGVAEEEAWGFLMKEEQRELLDHYFDEVARLAKSPKPLSSIESEKKKMTIGLWGALKLKLDKKNNSFTSVQYKEEVASSPQDEISNGFLWAATNKEIMPGCGGSIDSSDLMGMSMDEIRDLIFGKDEKEEIYVFNKEMYCVVCQAPPKDEEPKKMCGPCGICRECDSRLDD